MTEPEDRKSGYLPDPVPRIRIGSAWRGAKARIRSLSLPKKGGMYREIWKLNQNGFNSCTDNAISKAVYLKTGEKYSTVFDYFYSRAYDLGAENVADVGARPGLVVKACREHGRPPYDAWSARSAGFSINEIPPGIVRMRAQKLKLDLRAIYARGDRLVNRIVDSLHRDQPVVLTVKVDQGFLTGKGTIAGAHGEIKGLHLICLDHFRTRPSDGKFEIHCENSWRNWGDNGGQWLSPERVGESTWAAYLNRIIRT